MALCCEVKMQKMEKIINGQGKYFHNQLFNDSFLYPINYNRKGLFGLLKMHFMLPHLQQERHFHCLVCYQL